MVAELLCPTEEKTKQFVELLRPEPLGNGGEPEERIVMCGVSWKRYLALDRALGDDRPGPRFYYLDAELEIMSTSPEHEHLKEWFGDLMAVYFESTGLEVFPHGQATMRAVLESAGAEPDKSWCIGEDKPLPDVVVEIALTSGGVRKLEIYRRFAIPEVWIWRREKLEIYVLADDGASYETREASSILPTLRIALLERCVAIDSWQAARRAFRAGLAELK